jgi:flagellar biosynthesis protein FlhG
MPMTNTAGGGKINSAVITVCSGKGGTGKTTVVRTLIEQFKDSLKIAVIDGALGLSGISSVFGVFPKNGMSYESFLQGRGSSSDFIHELDELALVPSRFTGEINTVKEDLNFRRVRELIQYLKTTVDLVIVDSASGLGLGLCDYLGCSDIVLIAVTSDPQSITDGYAVCKLTLSFNPAPAASFFLNMAMSDYDIEDFNVKMALLTNRFLGRETRAMGYLKYDRYFMKSPGDSEFRSMIGNDNRRNIEEFTSRLRRELKSITSTYEIFGGGNKSFFGPGKNNFKNKNNAYDEDRHNGMDFHQAGGKL